MMKRALILRSGFDPRPDDPGPNNVAYIRALLHHHHFQITMCDGAAATRDGILAAFARLIDDTQANDAVVVYYTGHGFLITNPGFKPGGDLPRLIQLICPTDYGASNGAQFRGITSLELSRQLAALSARTRNITAIWDCCFSAQLGGGGAGAGVAFHAAVKRSVWPQLNYDAIVDNFKQAQTDDPTGTDTSHVVRVAAAGRKDLSYSVAMPPRAELAALGIDAANPDGRVGALTRTLVELLLAVRARPVTWRQLLPALRARLYVQHPEIEGPTKRVPFSLDIVDSIGVPVTVRNNRATLAAGALLGVAVGDVYTAVPATAVRPCDRDTLARLTVEKVNAGDSLARIEWRTPRHELPPDSVAIAVERELARFAVRVAAPRELEAAIGARIAASPLLRVAAAGDPEVARLRVEGGMLVLSDEIGPLAPPAPYPDGLAAALRDAENLATEYRLRTLSGGLDLCTLDLELGIAGHHEFTRVSEHGAAFAPGERAALRLTNRGDERRYVHVFDIGLRHRISLLSQETNGIALDAGASTVLGERLDSGRLAGFPLAWPRGLPTDRPRTESFMIVVTDAPADLRVLESEDGARDDRRHGPVRSAPSPVQALFAGLRGRTPPTAVTRSAAPSPTRSVTAASTAGQFAIAWRTFSVVPLSGA